ncbi:MAG: hypothetical protein AABW65_03495 [Nanoarchaeota archaeon]
MKWKIIALFFLILFSFAFAEAVSEFSGVGSSTSYANPARYQPNFQTYYSRSDLGTYWPIVNDKESCRSRQDFVLQIAPAGCQPAVVRSDLLAEQNVPVFCQIDALKINPLIDVKEINYIRFKGNYPKEVVGTGFHPARAALKTRDKLLGSPIINNVGYAVVLLKKNGKESELPEFVNVTLTGKIEYDSGNALGIGRAEFLLREQSDDEWDSEKERQSFWNGRYFLRLENANPDSADVSVYRGDRKVSSVRAERNRAGEIYLPGFYCQAGLEVYYDGYVAAEKKAKLEIGDDKGIDVVEVYEGSKLLNGKCIVRKIEPDKDSHTGNVSIYCGSREIINLRLKEIGKESVKEGEENVSDRQYSAGIENAFNAAIEEYEKVAENYPAEKQRGTLEEESAGEKALISAIKLSKDYGKNKKRILLMNKFIENYPESEMVSVYKREINLLYKQDSTFAGNVVYVDNKYRTIRVVDIYEPKKKAGAEFTIGDSRTITTIEYRKENNIPSTAGRLGRMRIDNIDAEEVKVTAYCSRRGADEKREVHILKLKEGKEICGQSVVLERINLEEIAKIRIVPIARRTDTEVNISVKIGIEKRAIKLSPDKAKEMIGNLNKSIEKWESISKNLGNVVSGLKGACFATSAVLQAKTFLTGLHGEGIARQEIMRGENGWSAQCAKLVARGEYPTLNACYLGEADKINKDVKTYSEGIKGVNSDIKRIEGPLTRNEGILGGSSVNRESAASAYAKELLRNKGDEKVPDKDGNLVPLKSIISEEGYRKNEYSYDQIKQYDLYLRTKDGLGKVGKERLEGELKKTSEKIDENVQLRKQVDNARELQNKGYAAPTLVYATGQKKLVADVVGIEKLPSDVREKFGEGITHSSTIPVTAVTKTGIGSFEGGNYIHGLKRLPNGEFRTEKILKLDNNGEVIEEIGGKDVAKFNSVYGIGTIVYEKNVVYNNRYLNAEVKYYENEPYKGMPAIVPIDTIEGWYVATKQDLPVFGGRGAFEASGRVSSFYLCNVGKDGYERFQEGLGDDKCQLINLNTGQPLGNFAGLSESKARKLVDSAVRALTEAAEQYGNKVVRVNGERYVVGKPSVGVPSMQCQDFMNPKDCHLMFNVCDPVICPSSRCDFGGLYPVADVIQTGIVGSTLLCLPNVKEKIAIPMCLTGIHAGIEGYVSILNAHRDCLQESLKTGRTVGICDQIYSVYMCEFFWRQVSPVANVILPKLVEAAYEGGQGTRGGGEYLTVMGAWQNTQKSINYFTNNYAVNSLKAFRIRSIEEAGTPFCKAFISAKAPTSFKSLIEPDSPPQFHAWFSSTKFTSATLPASSHYKVYYHIFSGKDEGVHYRVYLKSPPDSSYYYSSPVLHVASGFIGRGEYASETKDFTAPEGYQELCVDINGEEECGFKQVSSSFAIDYLRDKYASNQINQKDITSEKECISGRADVGALLANTNPTAAFEEGILPENYNRGITRICATDNPGSSTDPGRFVEIGYCDDAKVKCWLDKQSINKAVTNNNLYLKNKTLYEVDEAQRKVLEGRKIVLEQDEAVNEINNLKERELKIIKDSEKEGVETVETNVEKEIESIREKFGEALEKLFYNHHKAEVALVKARLKGVLAETYLRKVSNVDGDQDKAVDEKIYELNVELTKKEKANILKDGEETGLFLVYNASEGIYELKVENKKIGHLSKTSHIIINDSALFEVIRKYSNENQNKVSAYYRELNHAKIKGNKISSNKDIKDEVTDNRGEIDNSMYDE